LKTGILAVLACAAFVANPAIAAKRTVPSTTPQTFDYEGGEADDGQAFVEFHWDSVNYLEVMKRKGKGGSDDWNAFLAALRRDTSQKVRITTQKIGDNLNLCIDANEMGEFKPDFCGILGW